MTGFFIAFEGIDGSGKTTAAREVAEALRQDGFDVVTTREPGGTFAGRQIRTILLDSDHDLAPETELLLMCADRAEHVASLIRPALAAGAIVISDRFAASTRAYQGYGLGLDMTLVDAAVSIATGGLCPDLTVLFDVEPKLAFTRRSDDPEHLNALDLRDLDYRVRVREGFLALARESDRWHIVDASRSLTDVIEKATAAVVSALSKRQLNS